MNRENVVLLSKGIVHPSLMARHYFRRCIRELSGIAVRETGRIESLRRLRYPECAALVMYLHRQKISPAALSALDAFVRSGGGLLAVHSASASFKQESRYFDILGGRFISHEHVHEFTVTGGAKDDTVFTVIPAFTVRDELYIHEYDKSVTVHFITDNGGSAEPVAWTRMHGRGRVCYISLGHRAPVIRDPHVREMLLQGLRWIMTEEGGDGR